MLQADTSSPFSMRCLFLSLPSPLLAVAATCLTSFLGYATLVAISVCPIHLQHKPVPFCAVPHKRTLILQHFTLSWLAFQVSSRSYLKSAFTSWSCLNTRRESKNNMLGSLRAEAATARCHPKARPASTAHRTGSYELRTPSGRRTPACFISSQCSWDFKFFHLAALESIWFDEFLSQGHRHADLGWQTASKHDPALA